MLCAKYAIDKCRTILTTLCTVILAISFISGCAGQNYGKLDRDRDLDNMFLNYEVLPEHRYYVTGGYAAPKAILALHRDYELDNPGNLWVLVPKVDNVQVRKWIDTISPDQDYRYSNAYFAAYILTPDGNKRVGAWYAQDAFTTVKFMEGNKIQVYTPDPSKDIFLNRGLIIWGNN